MCLQRHTLTCIDVCRLGFVRGMISFGLCSMGVPYGDDLVVGF